MGDEDNLGADIAQKAPQPKLSEKQRKAWLHFRKMVKDWTVDDFKKVIWSGESLFDVMHPPNSQKDRVWTKNKA